jgi:hypothetical protein
LLVDKSENPNLDETHATARLAFGGVEGFKFLRTATFAGIVWILVVWVSLGTAILRSTDTGELAPLSRGLHGVGHGGTTLLAALVTFLIGTVSLQVFRAPSIWLANGATALIVLAEKIAIAVAERFSKRQLIRRYEDWRPVAVDLSRRIVEDRVVAEFGSDLQPTSRVKHDLYEAVDRAILRELEDPALAGSYIRRLNDRALLRLGLIVPTLALVAVGGWRLSLWLLVLPPVPLALGFQAFDYRRERDACLEERVWPSIFGIVGAKLESPVSS